LAIGGDLDALGASRLACGLRQLDVRLLLWLLLVRGWLLGCDIGEYLLVALVLFKEF